VWRFHQSSYGLSEIVKQRLDDYALPCWRFFAGCSAIVSWYNAFTYYQSSLAKIAQTSDGALLLWMMGTIGVLIVLDVLINDWTPDHVRLFGRNFKLAWHKAFSNRHLLFVALFFCYAAQPFVAKRGGYDVSLIEFFYLNATQTLAIAFMDVKQRTRRISWQRACR
jgi:hypothetical protein